jgi:DNA-binding transcriptional regulator YiaG
MKSDIDWAELIIFLEEKLYTHQELADLCNVSCKSVSNWKTKTHSPGSFARQKLTEILFDSGISLSTFYLTT